MALNEYVEILSASLAGPFCQLPAPNTKKKNHIVLFQELMAIKCVLIDVQKRFYFNREILFRNSMHHRQRKKESFFLIQTHWFAKQMSSSRSLDPFIKYGSRRLLFVSCSVILSVLISSCSSYILSACVCECGTSLKKFKNT